MYFDMKSYFKSNYYHTAKHPLCTLTIHHTKKERQLWLPLQDTAKAHAWLLQYFIDSDTYLGCMNFTNAS